MTTVCNVTCTMSRLAGARDRSRHAAAMTSDQTANSPTWMRKECSVYVGSKYGATSGRVSTYHSAPPYQMTNDSTMHPTRMHLSTGLHSSNVSNRWPIRASRDPRSDMVSPPAQLWQSDVPDVNKNPSCWLAGRVDSGISTGAPHPCTGVAHG